MCTLVVIKGYYPNYPIVVAANRDELLDRPSEAPQFRENGIYAPKDLQRGGAWTGVNTAGIFVGLTNRMDIKSEPGKLSRGQLVMDLLACRTMPEIDTYLSKLVGSQHNGFNLIVGSQHALYLVRGDGQSISVAPAGSVVAITNHGVGTLHSENNSRRVSNVLNAWKAEPLLEKIPDPGALRTLLDVHDDWRYGTCINQPEENYGTKSSHIVRLDVQNREWEYWHRERTGIEHICKDAFRIYERIPLENRTG